MLKDGKPMVNEVRCQTDTGHDHITLCCDAFLLFFGGIQVEDCGKYLYGHSDHMFKQRVTIFLHSLFFFENMFYIISIEVLHQSY